MMFRTMLITALVAIPLIVDAQQPPTHSGAQQPAAPPTLEEILQGWENSAKGLTSLALRFRQEVDDTTFNVKTLSAGMAKVLKMPTGSYGLRLEINEAKPDGTPIPDKLREKYVCSGLWFYQYQPGTKVITSRQIDNTNVRPDDGPFAFIFGMKAVDARKRFDMTIAVQDKDYTWIKVLPLHEQDKKDFTAAMVGAVNYANSISEKGFPLVIQWKEPGNNIRKWHFLEVVRNDPAKVTPLDFDIEADKKAGWKLQIAPAPATMQPPSIGVVPASGNVPRK